jgi:hypothetical protein
MANPKCVVHVHVYIVKNKYCSEYNTLYFYLVYPLTVFLFKSDYLNRITVRYSVNAIDI